MSHIKTLSRQQFLQKSLLTFGGVMLVSEADSQTQEKPAPLKVEWVKEFVSVSHGKFDRVKEMLENDHLLLHSSYDWGGGDFESGIEAAGHVGNKEIAHYLLTKGARYNIYLACMLGHLDTVKNVLSYKPELIHSKGPHGFTMLHHAQKGGEDAKEVVDFLTGLGATETKLDFWKK